MQEDENGDVHRSFYGAADGDAQHSAAFTEFLCRLVQGFLAGEWEADQNDPPTSAQKDPHLRTHLSHNAPQDWLSAARSFKEIVSEGHCWRVMTYNTGDSQWKSVVQSRANLVGECISRKPPNIGL